MRMDMLQGQAAIVTGASRGIGQGIAGVLAREGANVVIADIGQRMDRPGVNVNALASPLFPLTEDFFRASAT